MCWSNLRERPFPIYDKRLNRDISTSSQVIDGSLAKSIDQFTKLAAMGLARILYASCYQSGGVCATRPCGEQRGFLTTPKSTCAAFLSPRKISFIYLEQTQSVQIDILLDTILQTSLLRNLFLTCDKKFGVRPINNVETKRPVGPNL